VRILVVEDERSLREGLEDLLRGAGHEPLAAADGETALQHLEQQSFDLVLLDLMLPGIDGLEVCTRTRQARPDLPILMLTARGAEDDRVAGLDSGADDYVCKPFGARELLARIEALGRRAGTLSEVAGVLCADGCDIDLERHSAARDGREVRLTPREAGVLRWLYRHRRRAVGRPELLEKVWGASGEMQTRTVDMTVAKLRQKIERNPAEPTIVLTVPGVGYAWGLSTAGEST
jgi:DNA-binding response OmpR family regulator